MKWWVEVLGFAAAYSDQECNMSSNSSCPAYPARQSQPKDYSRYSYFIKDTCRACSRVLNLHGVSSEVSRRRTSEAVWEQGGLAATPPPFLKSSTPISQLDPFHLLVLVEQWKSCFQVGKSYFSGAFRWCQWFSTA